MLLLVSLSPCEISMTFMVGALLLVYYIPFLKLLSIALLTIILFSTLGVVYEIKKPFSCHFLPIYSRVGCCFGFPSSYSII